MSKSVKLIENFISWQGEGVDSGRPMIILRFKTCNRNCSWCDTSVKMRISAEAPYQLSDIQKTIHEKNAGLLITGGEPTVNKHFDEMVMLLNELEYPIANVETNGFRLYDALNAVDKRKPVKFIFSPKIFNPDDWELAVKTLESISPFNNVFIKIVYENNPYIDQFLYLLDVEYKGLKWDHRIWLMPEGTTRSELIKNAEKVFDVCEKYGFSFSSRDHIIYGFV
jgi:organic radical activating enzyme